MNYNSNTLMRSLPMVAAVLGNKYGVKIEIGGDTAFTDGNTIHLPSLPADCEAETMMLAKGFSDHEAAHIRETDFTVLENENLSPLTHSIWNIIEDWRVENALSQKFPGCKSNFKWLIENQFSKMPPLASNPGNEIVYYILYTVRSWDAPSIENYRHVIGMIVEKKYSTLYPQLSAILSDIRNCCKTTADAVNYAKAIVEMIRAEATKEPEEQSQSYSKTDKEPTVSKDGNSSKPNELDSTSKPGSQYDLSGEASEEQTESGKVSTAQQILKDLLNASEDELPQDMTEKLSQQLSKESRKSGSHLTVAVVGGKEVKPMDSGDIQQVKRSAVALHTRLSSLLQSSVMKRSRPARFGKLNPGRLSRISFDSKLFQRTERKQGISTSVHILLDCSGSMSSRIELATQACYAIADSLHRIKGVNVSVTAFPADRVNNSKCRNQTTVIPLLKAGERMYGKFSLKAKGSTPLSPTIWWAMQQDIQLPENRKIILILTDGRPDYPELTKEAIAHGKELGFEFYGIGIKDESIRDILPNLSVVVKQLNDLAPAMFEMLQGALLINHQQ